MSSSSGPLPTVSQSEVAAILQALKANGQLDAMLDSMRGTDMANGGTMSDACKRRFDPSDPDDDEDFDLITPRIHSRKQSPVTPTTSQPPQKIKLPEGIKSLEHWSKTMCELPKMATLEMSYGELVTESKKNPTVAKYLSWVVTAKDKGERVADLQAFLKASNWKMEDKASESGLTYPGSAVARIMKE